MQVLSVKYWWKYLLLYVAALLCPMCIFQTAVWCRFTMFSVYLSDCSVMPVDHVLCVSFRLLCDAGWPCSLCIFQTALWCRLTMFFVYLSDCCVMQVDHVLCVSFRLLCDAGWPCSLCIFQTALWCRFAVFVPVTRIWSKRCEQPSSWLI